MIYWLTDNNTNADNLGKNHAVRVFSVIYLFYYYYFYVIIIIIYLFF